MSLTRAEATSTAGLGFHALTVAEVRRETAEAVSIAFEVPPHLRAAFRFTPGQYLTLRAMMDGEEVRRTYSICSGLHDGELRIAIKRQDGGAFSCFANDELRASARVEVMPPMGRFTLEPDPLAARTCVAFAAGSGITPVLSILKSVLHREKASRFFLFYGNRRTASMMFRETLAELKDRFLDRLSVLHVLSREQQEVPVLNGRLDAAKVRLLLREIVPPHAIDHAFICGPAAMIGETERALIELNVAPARIQIERFTPAPGGRRRAPAVVVSETPQAIAMILYGGVSTEVPVAVAEVVLDAGLRAGLDLPYSCHGGMCCSCRAKLVSGEVEMETNYSLEPWELAAGYVLTCQSHPKTERVAVDYDQV